MTYHNFRGIRCSWAYRLRTTRDVTYGAFLRQERSSPHQGLGTKLSWWQKTETSWQLWRLSCSACFFFFPNKLVLLCYHFALGLCSYADLEVTPISMWSGLSTFAEDQDRSSWLPFRPSFPSWKCLFDVWNRLGYLQAWPKEGPRRCQAKGRTLPFCLLNIDIYSSGTAFTKIY